MMLIIKSPRKGHRINIGLITLSIIIGVFASFAIKRTASAHPTYWNECSVTQLSSSGTNPTGTGYLYRTIQVHGGYDNTKKGGTLVSSCNLTNNDWLTYYGLSADQVWFGTQVPKDINDLTKGYYYDDPHSPFGCVTIPPSATIGAAAECDRKGDWEVFQDDAAAITFAGDMIHCQAMNEYCPGNGGDIYALGVEPYAVSGHNCAFPGTQSGEPCYNNSGSMFGYALRGAGFFDRAPYNLTTTAGTTGGKVNNIPIVMVVRNTWSGGYSADMNLTLRYPQKPLPNWDYTPTISVPGSGPFVPLADASTYPPVAPGTIMNIKSQISNSGNTLGHTYRHRMMFVEGTSAAQDWTIWNDSLYNQDNIDGIAAHGSATWVTKTYRVKDDAPPGQRICFMASVNPVAGPDPLIGGPRYSDRRCIMVAYPPPTYTCGTASTVPEYPEPGDTFTLTGNFMLNGTVTSSVTYTMNLSLPAGVTGGTGSMTPISTIPIGYHNENYSGTRTGLSAPAGSYSGTYTISGLPGVGTLTCPISLKVANKPYLAIYGDDVFSGGGFTGGCGVKGDVKTFNKGTPNYAGAGSQLALFVLGAVTGNGTNGNGFASAKLRDAGTPVRPKGLTFANTPGNGFYGGNFGDNSCVSGYDFPSDAELAGYNGISGPVSDLSTVQTGAYKNTSGNLTISSTANVQNGRHITIYVKGNLTITENIQYQSISWTSISDIPTIKFIVEGNIKIGNNVTRLNGIYVARPQDAADTTRGTIYTCTNGSTTLSLDDLYDDCKEQLIVYGNLYAKHIKWLRTYKSLKDAITSENPYNGTNVNCTKPVCAAEVIISGPETYINNGASISNDYDSITSLPPIL